MRTFICILFIFFCCCNTSKSISNVDLKLKKSNKQIVIRGNLKEKKVTYLKVPIMIEVKNNLRKNISFKKIRYKYSKNSEESLSLEIFKNKNRVSNNLLKVIKPNNYIKFESLTRHFIQSENNLQNEMSKYIKKMLSKNKDTLHIGTVAEFKQNHKELFEKLTKGDSISIQFLDGKKLGERITVPVEW